MPTIIFIVQTLIRSRFNKVNSSQMPSNHSIIVLLCIRFPIFTKVLIVQHIYMDSPCIAICTPLPIKTIDDCLEIVYRLRALWHSWGRRQQRGSRHHAWVACVCEKKFGEKIEKKLRNSKKKLRNSKKKLRNSKKNKKIEKIGKNRKKSKKIKQRWVGDGGP